MPTTDIFADYPLDVYNLIKQLLTHQLSKPCPYKVAVTQSIELNNYLLHFKESQIESLSHGYLTLMDFVDDIDVKTMLIYCYLNLWDQYFNTWYTNQVKDHHTQPQIINTKLKRFEEEMNHILYFLNQHTDLIQNTQLNLNELYTWVYPDKYEWGPLAKPLNDTCANLYRQPHQITGYNSMLTHNIHLSNMWLSNIWNSELNPTEEQLAVMFITHQWIMSFMQLFETHAWIRPHYKLINKLNHTFQIGVNRLIPLENYSPW